MGKFSEQKTGAVVAPKLTSGLHVSISLNSRSRISRNVFEKIRKCDQSSTTPQLLCSKICVSKTKKEYLKETQEPANLRWHFPPLVVFLVPRASQSALNRLFDSPWDELLAEPVRREPVHNLEEKEKEYQLAIKTPADKFPKEKLDLSVEDGVFTVKGQYSEEGKTENGGYSSRFESFLRSVRLPENVDQDKIKADLKDGVLNVIFPKKENLLEASKVKKIPVEFADTAAATTATAAPTEQTTAAAATGAEH
eukprot:g52890.t1